MKKHVYLSVLFLLFTCINAFSQISNGNLQTWANPNPLELFVVPYGPAGSYKEPASWTSMNILSRDLSSFLPGYTPSQICVFQDVSGASGNGARIKTIKIEDPTISMAVGGIFGTDTLGVLLTGKIDLAAASSGDFLNVLKMGVPYTGRAQKINFKTKYNPAGADTANVLVLLSKYNSTTQLRDTIGFGTFKTHTTNVTTWHSDSVMIDFNPKICAQPDTITILCSSSGTIYPKIGSEFFVDEFTTTVTTLSCDSRLSNLAVSQGTLNPAFQSAILDYGVGLPAGTTITPTTSYTTSHVAATVNYTPAPDVTSANASDRTTLVTVTAEDPLYISSYTVEFHTISSDATLSDLYTLVGTFTPVFSSSVYTYTVTVAYSTTFTPDVYPTTTNQYATYTVTNASDISSSVVADRTTTIVVTAEDGVTTITYYVIFEKAPPRTNANLFFLTPSTGSLSPAFSSAILSYTVTLTNTPGTNPTVFASAEDPYATRVINPMVSISSASVADRTVTVVVTAEDGVTTKTYQVIFYTPQNPVNASISENVKANPFKVFPNPSKDSFAIVCDDGKQHQMQIIDISGKTMLTKTITAKETVDISQLPSGTYFVSIDNKYNQKINIAK